MSGRTSIRARLSGALLAMSLAWGAAVSAVVWFTVQHEVDELMDNTLQESTEILYGLLAFNARQLPLAGGGSLPAPAHEEHLVWQVVDARGEVLLRSHRAPRQALAAVTQRRLSTQPSDQGEPWRVFSMPFDDAGRVLHVGQSGVERREARLEVAAFTAGGALLVGALCALGLRRLLKRELAPIVDLSRAVAHFDPLDPAQRLAPPQRDELAPMHDAITALGTRLARHVANERAFSAHAAHALRTPLAGIVTQLAAAQQRGNPEVQPFLARTRAAATRLRQVVSALLTLFRSGTEARPRPVDVARLVHHLALADLQVDVAAGTVVQADEDLLAAALMNLLDNALRHGATQVTVRPLGEVPSAVAVGEVPSAVAVGEAGTAGTSAHPARAEPPGLRLEDNGPGVDADALQRLSNALQAQRYEGQMGLGLMLADLVCRAHGGRLRLVAVERGFCCELTLGEAG